MRISKLFSLISLPAVLVTPAITQAAPETGFYVGGAWGAYSIDESNLDDNDDMLKAFAGGQFSPWFGIEGQWTDFNRLSNGSGDRFDADGWGLSAVFSIPLDDRSTIFAKVGNFWWDSNSSFAGSQRDPDGSDPFFGAGFKFGFNRHIGLHLEWERFDISDVDLDTLSIGLQFTF